jgi:hypothetical protein
MTTPDLATEAGRAKAGHGNRFNADERKLLACVKAYVDAAFGVSVTVSSLAAGDLVVSDGVGWANKAMSGDATIDEDGVLTVADGAVTLAKLDSGIAPSHIVVAAGKYTTAGGAASEDQTLAGVLATDIVIYSLQDKGATPRTILTGKPDTDKITWTFSGDPSTDHIVSYQVLRAAT